MNIQSALPSQGKIVGFVAITIAIGALAACSGGSSPSSKASDPAATTVASADSASTNPSDPAAAVIAARKPCDLLTREDSESAVGQPLPQNTVNITLGMCDYNAADFTAGASVTMSSWESIKNAATGGAHQPQAISGIGDEALYFAGSEQGGSPLYVRKGDEGFLLELNGPKIDSMASADALVVEKELALKVLGKF